MRKTKDDSNLIYTTQNGKRYLAKLYRYTPKHMLTILLFFTGTFGFSWYSYQTGKTLDIILKSSLYILCVGLIISLVLLLKEQSVLARRKNLAKILTSYSKHPLAAKVDQAVAYLITKFPVTEKEVFVLSEIRYSCFANGKLHNDTLGLYAAHTNLLYSTYGLEPPFELSLPLMKERLDLPAEKNAPLSFKKKSEDAYIKQLAEYTKGNRSVPFLILVISVLIVFCLLFLILCAASMTDVVEVDSSVFILYWFVCTPVAVMLLLMLDKDKTGDSKRLKEYMPFLPDHPWFYKADALFAQRILYSAADTAALKRIQHYREDCFEKKQFYPQRAYLYFAALNAFSPADQDDLLLAEIAASRKIAAPLPQKMTREADTFVRAIGILEKEEAKRKHKNEEFLLSHFYELEYYYRMKNQLPIALSLYDMDEKWISPGFKDFLISFAKKADIREVNYE